jgi:glycosyltransferase involved in cell wall biosynthesis
VLVLNWRDTRHPEGGGSEVYVENIAAGLVRGGSAVTMFCARYPGSMAREVVDGVTVVRRGGRFSLYLWACLLYVTGRLGRPDVVVEVQNGMPFLASLYCRRPVVVLVHHVHRKQWRVVLPRPLADLGWWLESRVAPWAARGHSYVTVSDATRRELAGLGVDPARIQVVHNGTSPVPPDLLVTARAAQPTVAVVGRLVPHKRVELALDAVARLLPDVPELRLDVVGHGWWQHRLEEHARRAGLVDRARFLSYVDERTKHEVLGAAWVLAVPSLKEGWGRVVAEAGTHGTPSVGFREAGGLAESVHDGVGGLLVDDFAGFTDALRRLLCDEDLRDALGAGARAHALTFTWEGSVAAFADVLVGAVGAGREERVSARRR